MNSADVKPLPGRRTVMSIAEALGNDLLEGTTPVQIVIPSQLESYIQQREQAERERILKIAEKLAWEHRLNTFNDGVFMEELKQRLGI